MASWWTHLRARINPLVRPRLYTAYRIDEREYVARTTDSIRRVRASLREKGYRPQRLSAAKAHPTATPPFRGADLHVLSYARVAEAHPAAWQPESWRPAQCQYHIHGFRTADGIELYSHYELRPSLTPLAGEDVATWFRRMHTHYRPTYGHHYLQGVTDLRD